MRIRITGSCCLALLACANADRASRRDSTTVSVPDSAALETYADSVLDNPSRPFAILPNGDTLKSIAGMVMDEKQAPNYGIEHYTRNSVHYVRVAETVGRTPDRKPINSTRARLRLPAIDSTEDVVIWGLCSVNGTNDPFVIGIMRPTGDSVEWQASHAWRFDLTGRTIREIPALGVKCGTIGGDD